MKDGNNIINRIINCYKFPNGNGQTVYFDKDYLNGFLESNPFFNIEPVSAKRAYSNLVFWLKSLGYNVTTDPRSVDDDTFFFNYCYDERIGKYEDFVMFLHSKIDNVLFDGVIKRPFYVTFPEDSFPKYLPELPFLLKNEKKHGGAEKYLIRTGEEVKTLKQFYYGAKNYYFYDTLWLNRDKYPWLIGYEFDKNGKSSYGQMFLPNFKKRLHNDFILQSYVNTPTKYNTSLRVLTASSGDILCASLKYSKPGHIKKTKYDSAFDLLLLNPESPFYLNDEKVFSNTVSGGKSILLGNSRPYTELEKKILLAHGIDPDNAIVPLDVLDTSLNIATSCKKELGAICGIDYIFDNDSKKWKFLEFHGYPMLSSYAESFDIGYPSMKKDPFHFQDVQRSLDISARLQVLYYTMMKKHGLPAKNNVIRIRKRNDNKKD